MAVGGFEEIRADFEARVQKIVWCTVTTVDRKGRPRTRVLHPIWEGSTGYVVSGRESFKAKHLAANPYVSVSYWSPEHGLVVADCKAEWQDNLEEKRRIWKLFKDTPMPYGYDPEMLGSKADDPASGLLVLTPWRIELHTLQEVMTGKAATVWNA